MATGTVGLRHDNAARGSMARGAVELGNAIALYAMNHALATGGVITATVTSKVKSVNTINGVIGGAFISLAATDNLWTLSGTTVPASSFQKYLLLLDNTATPAASVQEGTAAATAAAVTWANIAGYSLWAPIITILNANKLIAGVLTVATDATHTFVPGTTLLGAAGITATYVQGLDASLLPIIGNELGSVVGNF